MDRSSNPEGMPVGLGRIEKWAIGGAVAFAVVAIIAGILAGGPEALHQLGRIGPGVALALLGLSLINYLARTVRWLIFTRGAGLSVPAGQNGLYYMAGLAMSTTPGKLGEAVRLWFLRRGHGYPYERTAGLMIADRLSDAAAAVLLTLAGLGGVFAGHGMAIAIGAVVVGGASIVLLAPRWSLPIVNLAYRIVGRAPRLFGRVRRMLLHAGRLGSPGLYLGGLVLALIGWGAEAYALKVLLDVFGADVTMLQAAFVFCFAMLVGAAAMLPGGLGGTEVSMFGLLMALGVQADVAVAATAVIRVTTLWFAVLLGFIALPIATRMMRADEAAGHGVAAGGAA